MILTVTVTTKIKKTFFDEDIDKEVKASPKTTINAKVIHATKKLQAFYNYDAKKSSSKLRKKKLPSKI